ncbi:DUF3592 domain-containing protein [Methylomagnum ishizawai]|uniref:DUF3592 domain-containing protein n=1 Tax=Methylomagnum ishizawai TaxID=1760988 RepID=UPI001C33B985|nr:DUF3592 domain-containing protein [Methylomagnum ishizawai]BBL74510.1 hypothetical protein MishRS11D_16080 [Methylomagnum ishizawai]
MIEKQIKMRPCPPTKSLLLLPAFTAFLGIILLLSGHGNIKQAWQSLSWPSVDGEILYSDVVMASGVGQYQAIVKFQYSVDSEQYIGDTIAFTQAYSRDKSSLQNLVAAYPIGSNPKVYYDPKNPSTSVLKPGLLGTKDDNFATISGGFMFLASLLGIFSILYKQTTEK